MVEENRVTLRGMWSSMYSKRVELALRVKGIEYEYMEEDLMNKSMLLLRYNPVHKKVPVLVHNGKPVAESLVILEYIDETWKHNPRLLPEDPYERAKVGFWANFLHLQVFEALAVVFTSEGEVQERAIEQVHE
ncbi:glutathione S-transferase U10-like [Punica granatum]|uniref:Glutathione S-transferase n=1 Tax=Punica granatum TaxID=22663 RepID=A0A6P8EGG6_PUNGR|nr:glutathione S-transferase U10-like [Punica granatum]